ncbi:hypothetical protein Poly30_02790 [Planctomycetes bacterium Poly30]|uniref:Uncharacterized protein n=1 Tax=Saltatorellus ferox TaxID=2528018 RepID=A0A518EL19_9BACT|nr:hypothetical protein Poly30_02790 [Planctomycetes bacterium Poly30]
MTRLFPLVVLVASSSLAGSSLAAVQFTGGPREVLPFDIFQGNLPLGYPGDWLVEKVAKRGDLVVAHSLAVSPVDGNQGALHIHRRTSSGWQVEDVLDASDAGVSVTAPFRFFGRGFALTDSTLFVPYQPDGATSEPYSVAVMERVAAGGVWGLVQTLTPHPTYGQSAGGGSFVVADGNRMVIGSPGAVFGTPTGILETYTRGANGLWSLEQVDTSVVFPPNGGNAHLMVGDRLAISEAVYEYGGAGVGWQLFRQANLQNVPQVSPLCFPSTVALDGTRLILGCVDYAVTIVFDLSLPPTEPAIQVIRHDETLTRDYNPPYGSLVAAEDGQLVIGVKDTAPGFCTVRHLEWYDGEYRVFDTERTGVYVGGVDIDGGESVLIAGPGAIPDAGTVAAPRFEVRPLGSVRAVPYCNGTATLLVSGSGAAPFDAARIRGYELPPGATTLVVAGLNDGFTASAGIELCIDAVQGLFQFSPLDGQFDGHLLYGFVRA